MNFGTVNGVKAKGGSMGSGGVAVANGIVFTSGYVGFQNGTWKRSARLCAQQENRHPQFPVREGRRRIEVKDKFVVVLLALLSAGGFPALAQAPGGRGRGAAPARQEAPLDPAPGSASVRTMSAWGRIRTAVPGILGWSLSVPAGAFRQDTFSDAAAKADALGVASVEGSSAQKVSLQVPKNLDANLAPGEVRFVQDRLTALALRMPVYTTASIGPDEAAARKVFDLGKKLRVDTIAVGQMPQNLAMVDQLAGEYDVNVAIPGKPQDAMTALQGRSPHLGVDGDLSKWMQEGVKASDAVATLKDRLLVLRISDRNAGLSQLLAQIEQLQLKLSLIVEVNAAGDSQAELSRSLDGFEKAAQTAMAHRVAKLMLATPDKSGDKLTPEQQEAVRAALPAQPAAKPKKARKLLVLDANIGYGGPRGGHLSSVAAVNMAIAEFAKRTGAFEPVFSNDPENLKYPKIKQFDAIYLNNTVGMLFADPEVREGLVRFVKEGGGLGGDHGTSHASMDWPEFGEMLGAVQGTHREPTEMATLRIDDPDSPLTAAFGGKEFIHQDEFYRFTDGIYSRDKLHVLLSMDVEKTDMNQGRGCSHPCVRPDNDYALAWIRSYGKGRVFFTPLGHTYEWMADPKLSQFVFAGLQFILGDLDADTTPSARLKSEAGSSKKLAAGMDHNH
jgi:type 1 glutamine amidotransferase